MPKKNCWEVKKCGREPGGDNVDELGICPAASDESLDGVNSGENAGRACWVVAGTLCSGEVQGTFASKIISCIRCEFYQQVADEEGADYKSTCEILSKIRVKS